MSFLITSPAVAFIREASSATEMVSPTSMVNCFFCRSSSIRRSLSASVSRFFCGFLYCWDFWVIFCFFTPSPTRTREEICARLSKCSSYFPMSTCGVLVSMVRRSRTTGALGSECFFSGFFCCTIPGIPGSIVIGASFFASFSLDFGCSVVFSFFGFGSAAVAK